MKRTAPLVLALLLAAAFAACTRVVELLPGSDGGVTDGTIDTAAPMDAPLADTGDDGGLDAR